MSWIEIIHVRASEPELLEMVEDFIKNLHSGLEEKGLSAFNVYSNAALPEDVAIHLCWPGGSVAHGGSVVGRRIAYQFRQNTVAVRHSVWKLEDSGAPKK